MHCFENFNKTLYIFIFIFLRRGLRGFSRMIPLSFLSYGVHIFPFFLSSRVVALQFYFHCKFWFSLHSLLVLLFSPLLSLC